VSTDALLDDRLDCPTAGDNEGPDIRALSDAEIVEEAIRRKRAAQRTFAKLLAAFRALRTATAGLSPAERALGRWTEAFSRVGDAIVTGRAAVAAWSKFDSEWNRVELYGDATDRELDDLESLAREVSTPGKSAEELWSAVCGLWGVDVAVHILAGEQATAPPNRRARKSSKKK